ncbi:hypothetical protein AAVH_10070 [Aphelenchoides avenae]|nr:hypothetical protein AAVH_10070 [Aphelenchus avenae]
MNLVSTEVLGSFMHGLSLDERNLRISRLTCFACAGEAPAIFQLVGTHDVPCLQISYEYRRKHPASDFIAAVFEEARRTPPQKLVVSIKDVGASSCVTVEALGRKLISEILEHYRTPAANELLTLYLPRLGRYPLYSRLTEALVRESTPTYGRKVAISFPRGATHAELWPDHTDYLNETTGQWTVPYKHGLIKWRRLS